MQSIRAQLLAAFGLILMVLAASSALSLLELLRAEQARGTAQRRYEVLVAIQGAMAVLNHPGPKQERYVQTPDGTVPLSRETSHDALIERLVRLGSLIGSDEAQQKRLADISTRLLGWQTNPELDPRGQLLAGEIGDLLTDMEQAEVAALAQQNSELAEHGREALAGAGATLGAGVLLALLTVGLTTRRITSPLIGLAGQMERLARHDHGIDVPHSSRRDEIGAIARALSVFKDMAIGSARQTWIKTAVADISAHVQKVAQRGEFADLALDALLPRLGLSLGAFYGATEEGDALARLTWRGAYNPERHTLRYDHGVVLQCAAEQRPKVFQPLPADYPRVHDGASDAPDTLVLVPLVSRDRLLGLVEMAGAAAIGVQHREMLDELAPVLSLAFDNLLRSLELRRAHDTLREKEEAARHQATHDGLTGLPNRVLFMDRLETALRSARRLGQPVSLLYVDLDGFKAVNDRHGHVAGDALLDSVARRLRLAVRDSDTVARLGGDEFALILPGTPPKSALGVARQVCDTLARPFDLGGAGPAVRAHIGASIGIAGFPELDDADALIRAADDAMYAAKRAGKGRCLIAGSVDQPEPGSAVGSPSVQENKTG